MHEFDFRVSNSEIYTWDALNFTLQNNFSQYLNGSNGTLVEDVVVNNWWALVALVLVVCTAAGNVLVCLAICWERRLQNVTNYFLMSLAITDLLVAILVMPLGILTLVKGE
ncbi:7 transmembrane receptor (rhodopsin family) domain-containing protein [Phthorimaea operculella]|nr:7 transmembrane receptor (rhodopsin family) domain-containing protein [Phthorimaea operculella]